MITPNQREGEDMKEAAREIAKNIVMVAHGIKHVGEKFIPDPMDSILIASIEQAILTERKEVEALKAMVEELQAEVNSRVCQVNDKDNTNQRLWKENQKFPIKLAGYVEKLRIAKYALEITSGYTGAMTSEDREIVDDALSRLNGENALDQVKEVK